MSLKLWHLYCLHFLASKTLCILLNNILCCQSFRVIATAVTYFRRVYTRSAGIYLLSFFVLLLLVLFLFFPPPLSSLAFLRRACVLAACMHSWKGGRFTWWPRNSVFYVLFSFSLSCFCFFSSFISLGFVHAWWGGGGWLLLPALGMHHLNTTFFFN